MSFLVATLLLLVNVLLVFALLVRTVMMPSALLLLSPTALARRWLRRLEGVSGKTLLDINISAKDLNSSLSSPPLQWGIIAVCIAGFALSGGLAYLLLAAGFGLTHLSTSKEQMDERSFEQFTRSLAAACDTVLFGMLFFTAIWRIQTDAFTLLSLMFALREVLLLIARRWLASDPDFQPYDENPSDNDGLQVNTSAKRVGYFIKDRSPDAAPQDPSDKLGE